ncbi:MAG TPA: spore coat protein U domain-containing protein [Vicinamibacterales bacterium]|jgi:spore coat protein U-like protein|nr:spore coat protein U domain-containing protein [Vicinamibacterales bacterium]
MRLAMWLGVLVWATPVAAQGTLSGTVEATLTLTSSCVISGDTTTSGANFGTLDFGTEPANFTGALTTQATGGAGGPGHTQIVCSPDVEGVDVSVDSGQHAGQGVGVGDGARALASGAAFVPYDVYSTSSFTTAYPTDGSALSVPIAAAGAAFDLPIFARINKTSAAALPAGTYTDSLAVTITF